MLRLENILGGEMSNRGGTGGGVGLLPHHPKFCFRRGVCAPPYICEVAGSVWKGNVSLPRLGSFLLRRQTSKTIAPIAIPAPPTPATLTPTIWFLESPLFSEDFCVGGNAVTILVAAAVVRDIELVMGLRVDAALETVVTRGLVECVRCFEVVTGEMTRTPDVSIINVAVIVL
jgi:hypothetical protein